MLTCGWSGISSRLRRSRLCCRSTRRVRWCNPTNVRPAASWSVTRFCMRFAAYGRPLAYPVRTQGAAAPQGSPSLSAGGDGRRPFYSHSSFPPSPTQQARQVWNGTVNARRHRASGRPLPRYAQTALNPCPSPPQPIGAIPTTHRGSANLVPLVALLPRVLRYLVNTPDGTVQRHTSRNSTVQIAQRCLSITSAISPTDHARSRK